MSQVNDQFIPVCHDGVHTQYREDDDSPNPISGVFREFITHNGMVNGPFKEYFPNGKPKIKALFEDGEFNGKYEEFYEDGTKKMSILFDNGTPITIMQTWYPSGNLRSRIPLDRRGRRTGWSEEYFDTNTHGSIPLTRIKYVDGDKHGPAYKFFKNGSPYVKAFFWENKLHGEYERYYPDKQNTSKHPPLMLKCEFDNGLLTGKYTAYYVSGAIKRILYFTNGKLNGRAFFYRQQKTIKTSIAFSNGQLNGEYHEFDDNGKVSVSKKYENNRLVEIYHAKAA